jgi:hypothetical protein
MEFKKQFVGERAKALTTVLLTRREDLLIEETKSENGLDYTVQIRSGDFSGQRPFGILLRATMTPVTIKQANQQLVPTMRSIKSIGTFHFPICVFYFTVKDDTGYYTWGVDPVVTKQQTPKLLYRSMPECKYLTDDSLDEIIDAVNVWYDVFESSIMR